MRPGPKPNGAVAAVRRNAGRPCEPDCQGYADYAAVPCPNPACDDRVKAAWDRARQVDRPCDCPAVTDAPITWHTPDDHAWDCGSTTPGEACGSCWACIAAQVAYHQVIASRGGAA